MMKKHVKKIIALMSVCALALCMAALTACGPAPEPEPGPEKPVVSVTLDKTAGTVAAGETLVLTATVKNSTDAPAFTSSDKAVATVVGSGKTATVTGVAAGMATITAAVGGKTATCAVTVTAQPAPVQELTLDRDYVILENGGEAFKTATITATAGTDGGTVEFASADETVATVAAEGNVATVTPHKLGVTTVTATLGDETAECTVEVASYGIDYQLIELDIDEETTITAFRVLDSEKDLAGEIRIPAQYWSDAEEGYFPVAEIAKDGFKGSAGITSVYLGDELLSVGQDAFKECEALTTVTTGAKLAIIGPAAFNSCPVLTTFNWAEDCVTSSIGAGAFGWSGITEIVIPATATGFNWGMFQCAEKLERVKIYAPITQIYNDTFLKCDSLAEVWLPATLTTISPGAFGGYAGFPTDGPGSKGSFKIHFAGTQAQWESVVIDPGNNGAIIKGTNENLTVDYEVVY